MVQKNLHSCANENMGKTQLQPLLGYRNTPLGGKPDAQGKAIITVNMTSN